MTHPSRILLAAALTFAATSAFAADGTFDKTLSLTGTPTVSISTGSGYVHVFPGSDSQLHIVGHVHSSNSWFGADAEARVKQIVAAPPIVQSENIVTIGQNHGDSDLFRNISIDYDVTTPASTALTAKSGSGDLTLGGILGQVTANTGSGSIKADNIGGNSHFETGSGSIHALNVHGAATIQSGSGNLELSLSAPGDVTAKTGSGSVHIDGVNGGLRASSGSGSIEAAGNLTSEWRLDSGSGSIHAQLDPNAHFNVNADTGSGSVGVSRPILMQGSLNKHHISGTVNGGGPTLRASTGSGNITIR